jgi:hypothetical protein
MSFFNGTATTSSSPSGTSAAPGTTTTAVFGNAQQAAGISLVALLTAMVSSSIIFGVQMIAFMLLKNKLARIL